MPQRCRRAVACLHRPCRAARHSLPIKPTVSRQTRGPPSARRLLQARPSLEGMMRAADYGHMSYVEGLPRFAPLDWDTERELAERWRASGDRAAARQLVEAHLRFVVKLAHSFAGYGIAVEELIGEGNVGLLEAVERFDPAQGVRF